ncbi:MAG: FtsX-like permease family protein, partial [Gemmatimonadaceae bacterium]
RDGTDGPWTVIVSEALAKENWPGESAVGKRIDTGIFQTREWEIIGVAKDVRLTALDAPSRPALYYSVAQVPYPYLSYVVRAKQGDPAALLPAMRRELAALDPALALFDAKTMESVTSASLARQRFGLLVAGGFAAAALLLATVGLYGVIAYGVTQRTREIGVRLALGARPGDVQRLVVGEGMRVALLGIAVGLAGAAAGSRLIRSLLFDVSPSSPLVYAAVAALAALVALAASWLPARRAAALDPTTALRAE